MTDVALYETGLSPVRVLAGLTVPSVAACLGTGLACGLTRLTGDGVIFIAAVLVVAGVVLAAGLTTVLLAVLGPRAETRQVDLPRSVRRERLRAGARQLA